MYDTPAVIPIADGWGLWPRVQLRSAGCSTEHLRDLLDHAELVRADGDGLRRLLARYTADPWLLEALSWQNPAIVNSWLGRYATNGVSPGKPASYYRGKLLAIGVYLQRYTTKNETIGFFGPIGWGRVDPARPDLVTVAGRGERIRHTVNFEPWSMQALARLWESDPEVRWHLPITPTQASLRRGDTVDRPRRGPHPLSPAQQAVLADLERHRHAEDLLAALQHQPGGEHWTRDQLTEVLDQLQRADCLWWGFDVGVVPDSDERLLAQLDRLPTGARRDQLAGQLTELTGLRHAAAAAAGDGTAVRQAVNALAEAFEKVTGRDASVRKKVDPDSRELLYHDVTVDWDATLGAAAIGDLAAPLELLMAVCRYASHLFAREIENRARTVTVTGPAPFEAVFDHLLPELNAVTRGPLVRSVMADVRQRIARLLPWPPASAGAAVHYRSQDLRQRWLAGFAAPGPGWSAARIHSPDIMLAIDATGAHQWVLGELHTTVNPLDYRFCVENQVNPGELEALINAATPARRHIPALRLGAKVAPRTSPPPAAYLPDKHRFWTLWPRTVVPNTIPQRTCTDLSVTDHDGRLLVVDETGQALAPLIEFLGEFLSLAFYNSFTLFDDAPHKPRVTIDNLVVQRETWRLPVAAFAKLAALPPSRVELRSFFAERGLPRYSFIRVPGEPKPVFCDAFSWITAHNVIRLIRKVVDRPDQHVQVQEMLPSFEQLWLTGLDGRPRTSEWRFVVQDLSGPQDGAP